MSKSDPYKDSPYDAAGMPLGTEVFDYDNLDERRRNSVRNVTPPKDTTTLIDIDYEAPKTEASKEFNRRRNLDKSHFNEAVKLGVNIPGMDMVDVVDIEDPAERKELLVKEAEDKGFKEVQELPKTENKETVEDVKEKAVKKSDEDDFESIVNGDKTTPGEAPKKDTKK